MPLPSVDKFGLVKNPLVFSVFTTNANEGSGAPPSSNNFLLSDGSNFLLSDGSDFLLS